MPRSHSASNPSVAADALGCGCKVAAAAACAPLFAAAVADVACVADSAAGLVGAGTCADSVAPPALLAPLAAVPPVKPVLEINPSHPIVERLKQEPDPQRFSDWSYILFEQATLAEGGQLDDPATFVKRLNQLMLALAGGPVSRIWTPS